MRLPVLLNYVTAPPSPFPKRSPMHNKNLSPSPRTTPQAQYPVSRATPSHAAHASPYSYQQTLALSDNGQQAAPIDHFSTILGRIWHQLLEQYFPERPDLSTYCVEWSSRKQKRVLASCDILGKRVRVARELARPEYLPLLSPLLYHEMCHAVIGREVETRNGARLWHGPQFKVLEARHPDSPLLQQWISAGGWATAVRRDRAFSAAHKRNVR